MKFKDFKELAIAQMGQETYDRIAKESDEELALLRQDAHVEQVLFLTEAQASRILGTTKATVKKWALRGKIPHSVHPVNGRRRYQKEVLDKLVKDMGKWI